MLEVVRAKIAAIHPDSIEPYPQYDGDGYFGWGCEGMQAQALVIIDTILGMDDEAGAAEEEEVCDDCGYPFCDGTCM